MLPFTQLFWYKLIFTTELLVAETLFVFNLKRRSHFWLRLAASLIVLFCVAFFFPLFNINNPFYTVLVFFVIFAVSVGLMKFVFDESFLSLLFCGIAAYAVQHLAYQCYSLLVYSTGINGGAVLGLYGEVKEFPLTWNTIPVYIIAYFCVYWACTVIFASKIKKYGDLKINSVLLFCLFVLFVLAIIVINMVVTYEAVKDFNLTFIITASLSAVLSCLFVMFLLFTLLSNETLKTENEYMNRLWLQEQKQFKSSKANVDFINTTYHDLKYQINLLKENPNQREELLKNIDRAFQAYDSNVVTGNEALDIILTERATECNKNDIKMNCMVDGKLFNFMSEVDLYIVFGNALDNAMEAVLKLDNDSRSISVTSYKMGEIFSVCIRNYCVKEPKMQGGLPLTTKKNKERHGYGMQSIKRIVEKYGGNMQVVVRDGVFNLTLLFFLKG